MGNRIRATSHVVLAGFVLLVAAAVAPAQVRDQAGIFTPAAVDRANRQIDDLRRRGGGPVVVETFASAPAEVRSAIGQAGPDRAFADYAQRQVRAAAAGGSYVLVSMDPTYVEVAEDTRNVVSRSDTDAVRDALVNAFRQRNYDAGLDAGVGRLVAAMARGAGAASPGPANRLPPTGDVGSANSPGAYPGPAPAPQPYPSGRTAPAPDAHTSSGFSFGRLLFWGLLIVIGLVIVRRILRRRAQSTYAGTYNNPNVPPPVPGQGGYYRGAGGYPGGGGFGRGAAGGLLGGILGSVIGGRVFGQQSGGSSPHTTDTGGSGGGFDPGSVPDTSNVSGGNFGPEPSSGSGADFGGGGDAGGDSSNTSGGSF